MFKRKATANTKKVTPVAKKQKTSYLRKIGNAERSLGMSKEIKIADGSIGGALAVLASCNPNLLNGVSEGTGISNRIGRRVTLKTLSIKGFFSASVAGASVCRLVCVYDKQTDSTAPASGVYFNDTSQFNSLSNINNQGRFVTLFDQEYELDCGTGGVGGRTVRHFNLFKNMEDVPVHFSGTGATAGSIDTGGVFIYFFCTASSAAAVDCYTRVKYTDN